MHKYNQAPSSRPGPKLSSGLMQLACGLPLLTVCVYTCMYMQADTSAPLKAASKLGLDPAKGFNQPSLNDQQRQVGRPWDDTVCAS